jgi:hypothetical protein
MPGLAGTEEELEAKKFVEYGQESRKFRNGYLAGVVFQICNFGQKQKER